MGLWKAAQEAFNPIFRPAGTQIEGINPGDWNSPQQPIRPIAPPGMGIRSHDFRPGINLTFTPRADAKFTFAQLRNIANSFDLCRLMIETRKDQIVNRPWVVRVKPLPGEKKKDRLAREANNPSVSILTEFFKKPDGINPFPLWIRMWLEELLAIDAPVIYPQRNLLGRPLSLRLISGDTITPLLDNNGFRPLPPNPAYQQIILGLPTNNLAATGQKPKEWTVDELIYSPRNPRVNSRWGFGPPEQIATTLQIAANWQYSTKAHFTEGNVPEGVIPLPESWTVQQMKDFTNWFFSMLNGNLAQRSRLIPIPDTKKGVQFSKEKTLIDPTINEYLIRVVSFAFSISPQNLLKQVNRGTAKESSDVAQIEGLEPYLKHIETVLNIDIIEGFFGINDVEFAYADEREMDPLKQMQVDTGYVNAGIETRNEVREDLGLDPLPQPEANEPLITTATGAVPLDQAAGGGDPNAQDEPNEGKSADKVKKNSIRLGTELLAQNEIQANKFQQACNAFFSRAGLKAAKQGAAAYSKFAKLRKDDSENQKRFEEILAAMEIEWETFGRDVTPLLQAAATAGVNAGSQQIGVGPYVDSAKSHAWQYANDRGAELVGMKWQTDGSFIPNPDAQWAISETTRNELKDKIRQAFEQKWKPAQLAEAIEDSYSFSADRAAVIAKTEIARAQAMGNLASWQKSGVIEAVQWQTSADHECCDVCDAFEAQGEVAPGHEFAPGITAPGAHPFCNCALVVKKVREAVAA